MCNLWALSAILCAKFKDNPYLKSCTRENPHMEQLLPAIYDCSYVTGLNDQDTIKHEVVPYSLYRFGTRSFVVCGLVSLER